MQYPKAYQCWQSALPSSIATQTLDLTPSEDEVHQRIAIEFHDFLDVFYERPLGILPMHKKWDHKIKLKEEFKAKKAQVIPMTPKEKIGTLAFVKENLAKGFIQPSHSCRLL